MLTVLVPLDGSPEAPAVLPLARTAAGLLGAAIHVLSVGPTPVAAVALPARLGLAPDQVAGLVLDQATGNPAEAIVRRAEDLSAALIVMSLAVGATMRDEPLGPVVRTVLQTAPCPLLLARPAVVAAAPRFRRILLPLDGTPSTAAAIAPAAALARRSGASLDVLLVVAPHAGQPAEPGSLTVPRYVDQPHLEWPAWHREFLDRFCWCATQIPPAVPRRLHLAVGQPADEILRLAAELGADLTVLVWRGELRRPRASTFRRVVAEAPCPVLAVRTGQKVPWAAGS